MRLEHLWSESSLHGNDTSPMAIGMALMGRISFRAESLCLTPEKVPLDFTVRVAAAKVSTSLWRWK